MPPRPATKRNCRPLFDPCLSMIRGYFAKPVFGRALTSVQCAEHGGAYHRPAASSRPPERDGHVLQRLRANHSSPQNNPIETT